VEAKVSFRFASGFDAKHVATQGMQRSAADQVVNPEIGLKAGVWLLQRV
jgi:hypothetical protein